MIEIKLQARNNRLEIIKYKITYPFSLHIQQKSFKRIYWNVASLQCKYLQGSYRLYFSKMFDISSLQQEGEIIKCTGGELLNITNQNVKNDEDDSAKQFLIFQKRLLLYVNERNTSSYINEKKNVLPPFLISSEDSAKKSIQFWLEYEKEDIKIKNEEIHLYLHLEYE